MRILQKLNIYLILYPFFNLLIAILFIIILRGFFLINVVYADTTLPHLVDNVTAKDEKNSFYQPLIIGVVFLTVIGVLYIWYYLENGNTENDLELVNMDGLIDVSMPIKEYTVALFYSTMQAFSEISSKPITDDLLFQVCFFNVIAFCHENFSFESLLLSSKTALLNDPNNDLTQIMKCYGHMYNQLFDSEELIAKNLGIAHLALTHLPPNTALKAFIDNSQISGLYKELSLQFKTMAEEQHIMASVTLEMRKKD